MRAQRRPALVRLEHQRQPELGHERIQHGLRAEFAKGGVGQRHPVRGGQSGARQLRLRGRLVPGPAAGVRAGADVRNSDHVQHGLHRPVLPFPAVQGDHDRVRPLLLDAGQQPGVGIPLRDGHADRAQCGGQSTPRAQ